MTFDDYTQQAKQLSNILNGPSKIDEKFLKGLWDASEGGDPSQRVERAVNQLMAALEKGEVPAAGESSPPRDTGGNNSFGGSSGKGNDKKDKKDKKGKKDKKEKDGGWGGGGDFPSWGGDGGVQGDGGSWGSAPPGGSLMQQEAMAPPATFGAELGTAGMLGPTYAGSNAGGLSYAPASDGGFGAGASDGGFGAAGGFGAVDQFNTQPFGAAHPPAPSRGRDPAPRSFPLGGTDDGFGGGGFGGGSFGGGAANEESETDSDNDWWNQGAAARLQGPAGNWGTFGGF